MTVGDLRRELAEGDADREAYLLGALLREANSRDVWLYTTPEHVRNKWKAIKRHLGRSRAMWAWILGLPE
jgi:hypothetical protein